MPDGYFETLNNASFAIRFVFVPACKWEYRNNDKFTIRFITTLDCNFEHRNNAVVLLLDLFPRVIVTWGIAVMP